eukprot:TRINITY_DN7434_c1_g1_i1.p1 TRINITY_DN7434_c1_g1~~TRINITY_DN7434_c1_g1_i1.p1  ORF type:complete len:391 (+),score=20.12 TRINITY_DN7434_c1_g1_i1:64-1236(+)
MLAPALIFACLICFCRGMEAPKPPKLAPQFKSNFTISGGYYGLPYSKGAFTGQIWVDFVNAGFRIEIAGEAFAPVLLQTNIVLASNETTEESELFWFEGPNCLRGAKAKHEHYRKCFPYMLPPSSEFIGNVTANGKWCAAWRWDNNSANFGEGNWTSYVDWDTGALVQVDIDNWSNVSFVSIIFEDAVVGPIDPSVFAPPAYRHCLPVEGSWEGCEFTPDGSTLGVVQMLLSAAEAASGRKPANPRKPSSAGVGATPIQMAPQFIANFSFVYNGFAFLAEPGLTTGYVAVDTLNGGLFASFAGQWFFPVHYATNVVFTPLPGNHKALVTPYMYNDDFCLSCGNGSIRNAEGWWRTICGNRFGSTQLSSETVPPTAGRLCTGIASNGSMAF